MAPGTTGPSLWPPGRSFLPVLYVSALETQQPRAETSGPLRPSGGLVSAPPSSPGVDSWSENSAASYQGQDIWGTTLVGRAGQGRSRAQGPNASSTQREHGIPSGGDQGHGVELCLPGWQQQ